MLLTGLAEEQPNKKPNKKHFFFRTDKFHSTVHKCNYVVNNVSVTSHGVLQRDEYVCDISSIHWANFVPEDFVSIKSSSKEGNILTSLFWWERGFLDKVDKHLIACFDGLSACPRHCFWRLFRVWQKLEI